jgi:drug/metabolite transporter (DMT)-like permease
MSLLLQKYPIGKISVYAFMIPVTSSILSALVLGETLLRWQYLVALALVCIGIVIVNRGKTVQKERGS